MVGEILKKRREESGRDLRDISNILKIKHDYLKSIEDDAFDKLPEPVYVKGYIREYAEFLNIDAETVLKAYTEQVSPAAESKVPETEAPRGKKTRARTLAISLILVLLAVIVLFFVSPFAPSKEDTSSPPSPPLKKSADSAASADKPVVETPLPGVTKTVPSPSNSETERSSQPPVETKKKFVPTADQSKHVLEIIADDITWLAITTDEAAPKEVMMNPGETLNVKAYKNISLTIGNAGGVKLIFNGKEIRDLGEKGEVITIHLPGAGT